MISLVITALASSDENTEPKTELSMRTSKGGLIWIELVEKVRDLLAICIAPGLARPIDTIDVLKLFISADIVDLIVEQSNSKENNKRLSKLQHGKTSQMPTLSHAAG